jgi:hypothetical protein
MKTRYHGTMKKPQPRGAAGAWGAGRTGEVSANGERKWYHACRPKRKNTQEPTASAGRLVERPFCHGHIWPE